MSSNPNSLPSISDDFLYFVGHQTQQTPETSLVATIDESHEYDLGDLSVSDIRSIIDTVILDEQGFAEDTGQTLASTLIENSFDADVIPQVIDDFSPLEDGDLTKIGFGVNLAKTIVETSLQNEVHMILNGSKSIFKKDIVNLDDLFSYYFGEESKIVRLLKDHLLADYETILKWLNTIFVMQAYRLSATQLFHKYSLIDKDVIKVCVYCVY